MPGDQKNDAKQAEDRKRVSVVIEKAQKLSSELSSTVGELAELLKNFSKESASGKNH